MSKQQHTPGPWSINGFYIDLDAATRIATVSNWRMSGAGAFAEACANARLIAAAPELLEALEYMLETNESGDNAGDQARAQARAAIAKARGES